LWWPGQAWFIVLAFTIWLGNRWLLFKQREHFDWFSHPLRKLLMLVTANVLYTAPLTLGGLLAWFRPGRLPVDRAAAGGGADQRDLRAVRDPRLRDGLFLIRERESDLLRVERLERLRAQAELGALKAQVDPHFLFNSLNTLGHLIDARPGAAREFCDTLAEVYRYVLASRERDLVPLADELASCAATTSCWRCASATRCSWCWTRPGGRRPRAVAASRRWPCRRCWRTRSSTTRSGRARRCRWTC
jgi:hypothetical protein